MSDKYNQTNISGERYTRASEVRIINDSRHRSINFIEEDVFNVDGKKITSAAGTLTQMFTDENAGDTFELLSPVDGSSLGASLTYQELYVALYSLYIDRALARDLAGDGP